MCRIHLPSLTPEREAIRAVIPNSKKAIRVATSAVVWSRVQCLPRKCKRGTCQTKAVDRNGKRLAGAAKKSFMQKCEREA
jgi:hypothetical protein